MAEPEFDHPQPHGAQHQAGPQGAGSSPIRAVSIASISVDLVIGLVTSSALPRPNLVPALNRYALARRPLLLFRSEESSPQRLVEHPVAHDQLCHLVIKLDKEPR